MDTYWLPPTNVLDTGDETTQNTTKSTDSDVGTITNSTMASFANIFAGASAAIASSTNVNSEILHNGKNFMVGSTVPPLNQLEIPSANQLSKRSGVFPIACTLPGMASISNIGLANGNMIISGTPGDLQQIASGQLSFASTPQMTVTISKDFIQQAAAESGVTVGQNSNMAPAPIYTEQQGVTSSSTTASVPANSVVACTEDKSEMPLKCPNCNETFKQPGALTYHTFVAHAQLQSRPYKCVTCPESFFEPHHLEDHMKAVHSHASPSLFTCSECQMSFSSGGNLNYHIYAAHTVQGPKPLQYTCAHCGKDFIKPNLLTSHIKNVHGAHSSSLPNAILPVPVDSIAPSNEPASAPEKQNFCGSCNKVFKSPFHLKQHVTSAHEKPHKCELCGKGFGRRSDLNRHNRGVHMRERPHTCNKCGWTFAESGNLKHHMLAVHSKEKNFRCSVCHRCFSISSYLKTHMARVHGIVDAIKTTVVTSTPSDQPRFLAPIKPNLSQLQSVSPQSQVSRCFECGQMFANATMLQNHVMSTHPQPFWCTVCGEGFSLAYQLQLQLQLLQNHLQQRHTDNNNNNIDPVQRNQVVGSNPVVVASPNQTGISPAPNPQDPVIISPKSHVRALHKQFDHVAITTAAIAIEEGRPHLCAKCGKGFKTATHLKQHLRCVHAKERPHKCNRCQKTFARMSDLNRHVKGVHEKLKTSTRAMRLINSKCSECGASFSETSQLKRHFLTVHLNQRPSFKCADCQEGFPDEASFKSHICHEQERPHTCSVCTKRFAEPSQVRRHMRSSHGQFASQQRHKCNKCSRAFTRPVDLERHIHAVHLKEKPHKCMYCSKYFGLHGNLNKHIRAVHMLEKPHQCVECGKCFAHIGVLKRHLRDIHFYDRRPRHNNPRLKGEDKQGAEVSQAAIATQNGGTESLPVPEDLNDSNDQLSVLQALEVLHQEHQLIQHQSQESIPQQTIELIARSHALPMVQPTVQIAAEPPVPPSVSL